MRGFLWAYIPLFLTGVFLMLPLSASAATLYVNSSTGSDSTGDGSVGTPYTTFYKGYTTANANDTLNLTGTFTWTDADETGDAATTGYTLGKNLTIVGQGSDQTYIQAATASTTASARVFTISTGVTVSISKVNIRHGRLTSTSYYGGGISNNGTLTITDSEINNNTAGGGGGGIDNVGTTTAQRISVYNNTVSYMGGGLLNNYNIAAGGYFVLENSTVYGNFQTSTSGYLNGGGIHVRGGSMALTNNSIIGNTSKGGGGLGMETTGTVYLMNNLIVNNTAATYGTTYNDMRKVSGTIVDNGYNIIGQPGGYTLAATGDWSDTNIDGTYNLYSVGTTGTLNLDSGTGRNDNALATPTWATLSGSIAINAGGTGSNGATSTVPTLDQRGATRSGLTDIGAFEYGGTGLSIVAPTTQASGVSFSTVEYNTMTVSWTSGNGSRRTVFMKAASTGTAVPVDGTIYTASSAFGSGSQIGTSGWYAVYDGIGSSVGVTGLTQATTYIVQVFEYNGITSGQSIYQTASASNNPNTQASHTITTVYANATTGNDSTGDGTSSNPYKTFNAVYTAAHNGDTINLTGTFTWTDAAETGDSATSGFTISKPGLTIAGQRADQTIVQSDTASTTADRRVFTIPTGVTTTFKDLTIQNGRITTSSSYGGGIYSQGTTTVERVLVTNNYVNGFGGGIAQQDATDGGSLTVKDSTVSYNTGVSQGGGIWNGTNTTGPVDITNSTIAFNTQTASIATVGGGGVAYRSGGGTITNSTIAYNNIQNGGTANGAGLWTANSSGSVVHLMNTIITNNYKSGVPVTTGYYDIYKGGTGTYSDNGANIIGDYLSSSLTIASSTYVDLQGSIGAGDGTYTNTNGGSGSLYLDSVLASNSTTNYTPTLAITNALSIAVDIGFSGTNNSISIPTADQRGALVSARRDSGAFEYGGTFAQSESAASPGVAQILRFPDAPTFRVHAIQGDSIWISVNNNNGNVVLNDSGFVYRVLPKGKEITVSLASTPTWYDYPLRGLACGISYTLSSFVTNALGTAKAPEATFSTRECARGNNTLGTTATKTTALQEVVVAERTNIIPTLFTRDLTLRAGGADVTSLQQFLIAQETGTASNALKQIGATGYFGSYTRQALAEYQKVHAILPSVGYFGPLTRAYLKK